MAKCRGGIIIEGVEVMKRNPKKYAWHSWQVITVLVMAYGSLFLNAWQLYDHHLSPMQKINYSDGSQKQCYYFRQSAICCDLEPWARTLEYHGSKLTRNFTTTNCDKFEIYAQDEKNLIVKLRRYIFE